MYRSRGGSLTGTDLGGCPQVLKLYNMDVTHRADSQLIVVLDSYRMRSHITVEDSKNDRFLANDYYTVKQCKFED